MRSKETQRRGDRHTSEERPWVLLTWLTQGGFLYRDQEDQRLQVEHSGYFTSEESWGGQHRGLPHRGKINEEIFCKSLRQKAQCALKQIWFPSLLHAPCKQVVLGAVLTTQDGNCDESVIQTQVQGEPLRPDSDVEDSLGALKWILSLVSTLNNR